MSNQYVFNQYYIDFIKRLKQAAKKMKEDNSDDNEADSEVSEDNYLFAKTIIKTIKAVGVSAISCDIGSPRYI